MGQPGFFDRGLDTKKDPLVVLNAVVPWEDFRARLSAVWRKPEERKTAAGRKPWDAVIIFKHLGSFDEQDASCVDGSYKTHKRCWRICGYIRSKLMSL